MSRKKKYGPCAFCGKPGGTRDHIPPKGLYAEPRTNDLITVPACRSCNGGSSADDEFMMRFSMLAGAEKSEDGRHVADKVMKNIEQPRTLAIRDSILRTISQSRLVWGSGNPIWKIKLGGERMLPILEKVVKGLFWTINKTPLPENYIVHVRPIGSALVDELLGNEEMIMRASERRENGRGAFAYRRYITGKDGNTTVWRLSFYSAVEFMAYTVRLEGGNCEFPIIVESPTTEIQTQEAV